MNQGISLEKAALATAAATAVFGFYQWDDVADPQTFLDAAAAILATFTDEVIAQVSHPVAGVLAMKFTDDRGREYELKRLDLQHLRRACERIHAEHNRSTERRKRIADQLAERDREDAERATHPQAPPPRGLTPAQYITRYGDWRACVDPPNLEDAPHP